MLEDMSERDKHRWPTGQGSDDDEDTRNQRIAAMRELAAATQAMPDSGNPAQIRSANTPSGRRPWPALLAILLAVVVLVSVGAAWKGLFPWQQHAKPASNVTSINLADVNLF